MQYVYYRYNYIAKYSNLPGISKSYFYQKAYSRDMMPIDRTGTIKWPVRAKNLFPLPKMRNFTETFEEVCNLRATELLLEAERLGVPLYVFWSGGIDSTCLLVSFLKIASKMQKERIVVLLSDDSIAEYPLFYEKYIKGQLRCQSALLYQYLIGTRNLLVLGEHNDQLFGSDIIIKFINLLGFEAVVSPYNRRIFTDFFAHQMELNFDVASFFVGLFERLAANAPIPLKTNYDYLWWINFAVKWQTVFTRMFCFTAKRNIEQISEDYIRNYYRIFYNTEDFQLWSMNNLDKRIRGSWREYKWPSKEVIFKFTNDADYRDNKIKRGSLQYLWVHQTQADFVDENFKFCYALPPEAWYQGQNDFV